MSVFGIYVICLTVAYIIYYAVMISMELTSKDKNKNKEVMEISVNGGGVVDDDEEEPVLVQMDHNSATGFVEGGNGQDSETEKPESGSVDEFDNAIDNSQNSIFNGDPVEEEEERQAAEEALFCQELSEAVESLDDIQRTYQYTYDSAAMQMALGKTDGIRVRVHSRKKAKGGDL